MFSFKGFGLKTHSKSHTVPGELWVRSSKVSQTHQHTLASSSSACISPISPQTYADRLNELHKLLKRLCHLGSKVSIPSCMSKRGSLGSGYVYVEIPPTVRSFMHRFGLVGVTCWKVGSLCSFQKLCGGSLATEQDMCQQSFFCGWDLNCISFINAHITVTTCCTEYAQDMCSMWHFYIQQFRMCFTDCMHE